MPANCISKYADAPGQGSGFPGIADHAISGARLPSATPMRSAPSAAGKVEPDISQEMQTDGRKWSSKSHRCQRCGVW